MRDFSFGNMHGSVKMSMESRLAGVFSRNASGKPWFLTGFGIVTKMKNSEMAQCSIIYFLYQYNFHFWETLVFQVFPRLSKNGCKEKRDRSDKIASNDKNNFRFSPLFWPQSGPENRTDCLIFPKMASKRVEWPKEKPEPISRRKKRFLSKQRGSAFRIPDLPCCFIYFVRNGTTFHLRL